MSPRAEYIVECLKVCCEPLSAAELAGGLGLVRMGHETRRRRVREAIEEAREDGVRICANGDGYWLARSAAEWRDYLESRKSGARFEFVRAGRMAAAATEAGSGQMLLIPACVRKRSDNLAWA